MWINCFLSGIFCPSSIYLLLNKQRSEDNAWVWSFSRLIFFVQISHSSCSFREFWLRLFFKVIFVLGYCIDCNHAVLIEKLVLWKICQETGMYSFELSTRTISTFSLKMVNSFFAFFLQSFSRRLPVGDAFFNAHSKAPKIDLLQRGKESVISKGTFWAIFLKFVNIYFGLRAKSVWLVFPKLMSTCPEEHFGWFFLNIFDWW